MQRRIYRFGEFLLDPSVHELRRADELLTLPAYAFDCLVYLIEHRGRVVGRDELIAAVWGRVDVTDDQLGHIVRRARRAIGERGDEQGAIRTIPRVGFRWVHEVSVDEEPGSPSLSGNAPDPVPDLAPPVIAIDAQTMQVPEANGRRGVRIAVVVLIGLVVAAGAAAYATYRSTKSGMVATDTRMLRASLPTADVVAVLPVYGKATTDADWAWLRLGLMDFVASHLRAGGQAVVPSSDVVALVRDNQTPEAVEKVRTATNARFVLLSTVTKLDDGWSVRLELRDRDGTAREVQASAPQVIDAAQHAVDQLLERLGKLVIRKADSSDNSSGDELIQRAEAALLANRFDDARELLESAPADLRDSPESQLRLARIDYKTGKTKAARDRYAALLAKAPAESDPLLRARALNGLGMVTNDLDGAEASERYLTEAIALLTNLKDSAELGRAYFRRGNALVSRGHYDGALSDWASARVAFERAGDARALASADLNEGSLKIYLSRPAEALQLFRQAAEQLDRFGIMEDLAMARGNEIDAELELLQPAAALAVATQAGTRFDTLKNPLWIHTFKIQRARALLENGRLIEGRALLDELTRSIQPVEVGLLSIVQATRAEADLQDGSFDTAAALARQVLSGLPAPQGPDQWSSTRGQAWLIATRALRSLHRDAEAAGEARKFLAWADLTRDPTNRIQARLTEAELAWSDGRREAALAIYDDLMRLLPRDGGSPANMANVVISYGSLLIKAGYLERATAVVGQVARFAEQDFNCAVLQVRLYHALGQRDAWQAALDRAVALAGERLIPPQLTTPPAQ